MSETQDRFKIKNRLSGKRFKVAFMFKRGNAPVIHIRPGLVGRATNQIRLSQKQQPKQKV